MLNLVLRAIGESVYHTLKSGGIELEGAGGEYKLAVVFGGRDAENSGDLGEGRCLGAGEGWDAEDPSGGRCLGAGEGCDGGDLGGGKRLGAGEG